MSADGPVGPAEGTPEDRLRALGAGEGPPEDLPAPDDGDRDRGWDGDGDGDEAGEGSGDAPALPAAVLECTLADLAAVPPASMPPHVLARIDRALAAERGGLDAEGGAPARPGRRGPRPSRRRRGRVLLVTGALLVLLATGLAGVLAGTAAGPEPAAPTAAPAPRATLPPGTGPPGLAAADTPAALRAGLGRADYGALADPLRLAGCLDAHAVPSATRPAGARRVVLDGRPGVLLVLPTGVAARFRVLVVGEDCGPGVPATLADTVVGP